MGRDIIDFLPSGNSDQLNTINEKIRLIMTLSFFYQSICSSIQSFLSEEYKNFDAQVSENLCQIRAYQLIILTHEKAVEKTHLTSLFENARTNRAKCDELLAEYTASKYNSSIYRSRRGVHFGSIQEFIEKHSFISLDMSDIEFFFIQAFILSRYKLVGDYDISRGIDYTMLCNELNIPSKNYAKKLIHNLQRNVSNQSCQFIFSLLPDLKDNPYYFYLLRALYTKDEVGRHVMACYEVTRVILQHAAYEKVYIKIVAIRAFDNEGDTVTFILTPCSNYKNYILDCKKKKKTKAVILFKGLVRYEAGAKESKEQYIARFLKAGFEKIILSNMAQHPQYSGLILDEKKYNHYQGINLNGLPQSYANQLAESEREFLKYKYTSGLLGCTPENPTFFLLTYVCCDQFARAKSSQSAVVGAV